MLRSIQVVKSCSRVHDRWKRVPFMGRQSLFRQPLFRQPLFRQPLFRQQGSGLRPN